MQGLLQGKSTITATSGNKVYKYKVIVHTNGFQRQKTTMYVIDKYYAKNMWQYEMSWDKIKDAVATLYMECIAEMSVQKKLKSFIIEIK